MCIFRGRFSISSYRLLKSNFKPYLVILLLIFQDLQSKLKREHEEKEFDLEEVRQKMIGDKNALDEKIIKERNALREAFDTESLDLTKRFV